MNVKTTAAAALAACAIALGGCSNDNPREATRMCPPPDRLEARDRGIQSKDLKAITDDIIQNLLASPALAESQTQWLLVIDKIQNDTTDQAFNTQILASMLRVSISQYGRGRIQLVENRARLDQMQNRELDVPRDEFQQGDGKTRVPARVQPQMFLSGTATDLLNRTTNYYFFEFSVTSNNRLIIYSGGAEVKVAR